MLAEAVARGLDRGRPPPVRTARATSPWPPTARAARPLARLARVRQLRRGPRVHAAAPGHDPAHRRLHVPAGGSGAVRAQRDLRQPRRSDLLQWTLEYSLGSSQPFLRWPAASRGGQRALGSIDPTLTENGTVVLRLTATDTAATRDRSSARSCSPARPSRPLPLSFRDLEVPLAGIPIAVTRTYDSRRRGLNGDFGFRLDGRGRGPRTLHEQPQAGRRVGVPRGLPRSALPRRGRPDQAAHHGRSGFRPRVLPLRARDLNRDSRAVACNGIARFHPTGGYPGTAKLEILDDRRQHFLPGGSDQLTTLDTFEVYQPANVA